MHPLGDLGRQEPLCRLDIGGARGVVGDLGELAVVLRGAQLEVDPGLDLGGRFAQQVGGGLREQQAYVSGGGVGGEVAQGDDRGERALPAAPSGDGEPQPAGGGGRFGEQGADPLVEPPGGVHGPPQFGPGLDEPAQRDDEGGGPGLGAVHVDPDGDGLLDGAGDLPGRGERLVGGLRADARDLPQFVAARLVHGAHRGQSGRLDGREPQPALGDVLQPGDGDGLQLPGDEFVPERGEGGADRFDGAGVVGEHRAR
ncbi:hypothetical protein AB0885_26315, partial [Streptomyces sp. NPDC005534]